MSKMKRKRTILIAIKSIFWINHFVIGKDL
jgi:hypothetical protein